MLTDYCGVIPGFANAFYKLDELVHESTQTQQMRSEIRSVLWGLHRPKAGLSIQLAPILDDEQNTIHQGGTTVADEPVFDGWVV